MKTESWLVKFEDSGARPPRRHLVPLDFHTVMSLVFLVFQKGIERGWRQATWSCLLVFLMPVWQAAAQPLEANGYVGTEACRPCHAAQFEAFHNVSKKSRSFESIQKMAKGLPAEKLKGCFACHTTGYGKPGGFVSLELTPQLKNAGCEVCHGPGKIHVQTQDPAHIIKKVTLIICLQCHIEDRVRAFQYKPSIFAGSH